MTGRALLPDTEYPQFVGTICVMSGGGDAWRQHWKALVDMVLYTEGWLRREHPDKHLAVAWADTSDHAFARDHLAQEAMQGEMALFLDCDMVHPRNTFSCLYAAMNAADPPLDVLTGLYFTKETHHPVLYAWNEAFDGVHNIPDFPTNKLFEVGACGGGILMVRTTVFQRIRSDLGRWQPFANRTTNLGRIMEDLSFCRNCAELGIPIWCDPRVVADHLDVRPVGMADWKRAKRQLDQSNWQRMEVAALRPGVSAKGRYGKPPGERRRPK